MLGPSRHFGVKRSKVWGLVGIRFYLFILPSSCCLINVTCFYVVHF